MKNNKTYFIALGGVIAALSVVIIFMAVLFPFASIALPAMAGVLLISVVIEAGASWGFIIFAAVSILSFILTPNKEAAVYYTVFFGHYPVVKYFLENIKTKWLQWLCKMIFFNICMVAATILIIFISGLPKEFANYLYITGLLLVFNLTFIIYDFALSRLVVLYIMKIRKIFRLK